MSMSDADLLIVRFPFESFEKSESLNVRMTGDEDDAVDDHGGYEDDHEEDGDTACSWKTPV